MNELYTVSTQQYISTVILYIHSGHITATCFDRKRSSSGQWRAFLRYNKVALNGISFRKWNCISLMIYCCVLTVYNALYKCVNTQRDGFCQRPKLKLLTPPTSTECKNEWSYTSAPSICLHEMERDKLSFTFFDDQNILIEYVLYNTRHRR